jgi:dynein heavy chain 1
MINLGYVGEDFNIFELAATYVEYSLIPVLNSYKLSKGKGDSGTAGGFENIQKNLAQLKVHLVQCQQNILVPEIQLKHEEELRVKDDECKQQGRTLTTEDFEKRIEDPQFVKKLEKTVTGWIRDIRRITQLNHDPSQGSALQEINFWVSMERSLTNIDEQLKHNLFEVTTKLLQQANRITLVFSFRLDTGLE